MPNIIDILARALSLRQETALNSITPNRAGGIMYDTLLVLNQMQLEGGSLLISKVYASVSAMEADTTPTSDLTGRALKPGQLAVIVTSDSSSSDMGSEYRFNGPGSWTYVGKVGGLPLDTVPTQSSTKGITSGGVYTALAAMKAEGYKYMGIATPGSGGTAPGTPNQPVFYIAGPGSYPNFGSITVASGYLGFIKYSSGSWSVESVAVGKDYDAQISALDGQISQLEAKVDGNLMSARAKNALLAVFDKVAFAVPDVSAEMTELENALFNLDEMVGLEATYTQGAKVIWSDGVSSLDDLKADLVVKAVYGDGTKVEISTGYTLSGTLTAGTSTITVSYNDFTDTFTVMVTQYGSKMSYTMAEGTLFYKAGQVSTYTFNGLTCLGIQNWGNTNTRRVFPINFGNQKMHDKTGSTLLDAYPIKIPYGAKTVTCNISGDTQQIGCRVLYLLEGGHFCNGGAVGYPSVTTPSYGTGTNSLDISSISERSDAYLFVWGQRVSSATYVGHEPTAISVVFSNE